MAADIPNETRRIYSLIGQGNKISNSRRIGETGENSDSNDEQVSNVTSDVGPSINVFKNDMSLSSSTSTDSLKDANDLLNELDDVLPSSSRGITEHTTPDNHVEKKITPGTEGKNDDMHENRAGNTDTGINDNRPRNVSAADVDVEEIAKVSKETQEESSQMNVVEAHVLTEDIIDTAYDSETDITTVQQVHNPIVCFKHAVLDKKVKNSEAVDLTQILQTVKNAGHHEDENKSGNDNFDNCVRKAGAIVISVPSDVVVTSGNQNVAWRPTLPGEVYKASYKRKKVIAKKHTEIDNYEVAGEIRKGKRNMKSLKKLFCGCFLKDRETKVESVCYGLKQAEEDTAVVKKEEVAYDKVEYFDKEADHDNDFLYFVPFIEQKDTRFRRLLKRIREVII